MADGLQASAALAAATPTLIATAPTSGSVFNILLTNTSAASTTTTVWASMAVVFGSVANKDLLVPGRVLVGFSEYEKNAVVLTAGENIWVSDLNGTATVQVRGFTG
jgi:hypothetical protein